MAKEIEKVKPQSLAIPDYLKDEVGNAGMEKGGAEEFNPPRLKICQSMSPERQRSKGDKFIEGISDGQIFNSLERTVVGDKVEVIPLMYSRSQILFGEKGSPQQGKILCRSFNGINGGELSPTCRTCPNYDFDRKENKPPRCTKFMNFAVSVLPELKVMIFSFKSATIPNGKDWWTWINQKGMNAYTQVYELTVVDKPMDKGTFFAPVMKFKRLVTADEVKLTKAQYNSVKEIVLPTDLDDDDIHDATETPAGEKEAF